MKCSAPLRYDRKKRARGCAANGNRLSVTLMTPSDGRANGLIVVGKVWRGWRGFWSFWQGLSLLAGGRIVRSLLVPDCLGCFVRILGVKVQRKLDVRRNSGELTAHWSLELLALSVEWKTHLESTIELEFWWRIDQSMTTRHIPRWKTPKKPSNLHFWSILIVSLTRFPPVKLLANRNFSRLSPPQMFANSQAPIDNFRAHFICALLPRSGIKNTFTNEKTLPLLAACDSKCLTCSLRWKTPLEWVEKGSELNGRNFSFCYFVIMACMARREV